MTNRAIVDSSYLVALISPTDRNHSLAVTYRQLNKDELVIPQVIGPEVAHILRAHVGQRAVLNFLDFFAQSNPFSILPEDVRQA